MQFSNFDDSDLLQKYGSKLKEKQFGYQKGLLLYPKQAFLNELLKFGGEFAFQSNKIESVKFPLSRRDIQMLLHDRVPITPPNKPLWATLEIVNHQRVFETLLNSKSVEITLELIKQYHNELYFQTKKGYAGVLRGENNQWNVKIHGSSHNPPDYSQVPTLMNNLMEWYQTNQTKLHPIILTGLFHLKFESIHPFGDGNGRLGRLLLNLMLYQNDFPMYSLSYSKRSRYFTALERSIIENKETIFLEWFLRSYLKFDYFNRYNQ